MCPFLDTGPTNERTMHTILAPGAMEIMLERGPSYPHHLVEATSCSLMAARMLLKNNCLALPCSASIVVLFLLFAPMDYMYPARVNLWHPPNFLKSTSSSACLLTTATPTAVLGPTQTLADVRSNRLRGVSRGWLDHP